MLISAILILVMGFFVGQIAHRLGLPALVGMILVGIILGPAIGDRLSPDILDRADELRTVAVTIILMKAGLGLDRDKLLQQGRVALSLGILPGLCEASIVAVTAMVLFEFDFTTGLLLGCILGAESPAVIVPGMLKLKSLGWGVAKGIPDAILTGSALSDVLLLLLFSLLLNFLTQAQTDFTALQLLPFQVFLQIGLGIFLGYVAAYILSIILSRQNWTENSIQDVAIALSLVLSLVLLAQIYPFFSGYLAVMSCGFFLVEGDRPLARRLRLGFDDLWAIAQIFLFVLLGTSIQLDVLGDNFLPGILILAIGLLCGRTLGWYLATWKSNWTWREKLFLLPGNSAKATVQAAIGAIPFAYGIPGGEIMLALAALSILITAPLGAWAIPFFAPRLLQKGFVDPTKISLQQHTLLLAAVDTSPPARIVLTKVADLARRSNAEVIVLHVINRGELQAIEQLRKLSHQLLADIPHRFVTHSGSVAETIVQFARKRQVTAILMGKRAYHPWEKVLVGSVSQNVLETSEIPVIVVEDGNL